MTLVDFFSDLGLFTAKAAILLACFIAVVIVIALAAGKAQLKSDLEVKDLNEKYDQLKANLQDFLFSKQEAKIEAKEEKKREKAKKKLPDQPKPRLFVLNFKGDTKASQVENLREEISALVTVAKKEDEVLVKVESPGGVVHGYGLAAAQLLRLRNAGIRYTVSVDQVAASGGYLMACTAHKIICSPFGIVGSIGVVAQVPNFHRILKKNDVDFKEYTAGDFKRTVSVLGEITEKGEKKFIEQLEETHVLFKTFVSQFRPQLDLAKVATGEYWFGQQAKELLLVDELLTSDEFILQHLPSHRVVEVEKKEKKKLGDRISDMVGKSAQKVISRLLTEIAYKDKI